MHNTGTTPEHLGGHINKTHVDEGALEFLCQITAKKRIFSMLDIGCGPGGMCPIANERGIYWQGVDGDESLKAEADMNGYLTCIHDFTKGPIEGGPYGHFPFKGEEIHKSPKPEEFADLYGFDLAWSVEFLEHVEEQYIPNFMPLFNTNHYAIFTHALPGETGGHHHVNLQTAGYWIDKMKEHTSMVFDEELTEKVRNASTMTKGFMKKSGLVFVNPKRKV